MCEKCHNRKNKIQSIYLFFLSLRFNSPMEKTQLPQEKTQMEAVHFGRNEDYCSSTHAEISLPPDRGNCQEPKDPHQISTDSHDRIDKLLGEPEVSPRVGEEYQTELPTPVELESHSKKSEKSETQTCHDHVLLRYPIMLTWIDTSQNHTLAPNSRTMKANASDELGGGPGCILVPGLPNVSWNALEKDSLLLGLYIFEKDFVLVRRLIATKNMGSLLSFYYGHFYHSCEYHRWSGCRKAKSKKGIGQKIFSGARQQELLNRILVGVSEECRNDILEASKMFGEDQMSLSDYVFSLVVMVGIETLVDAIGIGKGKLDLTEMPLESSRSKPTRPEIPTGKELVSLTADEIVKILNGNYRLSKARANDIFWEAVWPRLLDRGWHSEQPDNQGFARQCLVFLRPGIKKFSRRKLVKGEHYFDSITDILSKVAKEPELIDLKSQEEDGFGDKKERSEISPDEKKSDKEKHCYLQPRTPDRNTDFMKFTVVDTSLLGGKVRELRSFPSEIPDALTVQDIADDKDVAMPDAYVAVMNLDGKTARKSDKKTASIHDLKKDSYQTKKVPKAQKAGKRYSVDHAVGLVTKRCRMLAAPDQEEKKFPWPGTSSALEGGPSKNFENAPRPPPLLIDLNLPGAPLEPENEELGRGQDRAPNGQPMNLKPRRLSTRHRPPTIRAMQAVADGYLDIWTDQNRKGKPKWDQ